MFKSFLKFNPPSLLFGMLAWRTFSLVFTHSISWCPLSLFVLVHLTIFQARYLPSHPTHDTNDVKPTVDNIYLGVLPSGVYTHKQYKHLLISSQLQFIKKFEVETLFLSLSFINFIYGLHVVSID